MKAYIITSLLCMLLSACTNSHNMTFFSVHKPSIQQGNILIEETVALLRPGLTKEQIKYLLGTPLIVDTFNDNHWDYIYRLRHGDGTLEQKGLRVIFVNDRVSKIEHEATPAK